MKSATYTVWHVDRSDANDASSENDTLFDSYAERDDIVPVNEWEMLSHMGLPYITILNELDLLGKCDFDNNNNLEGHTIPTHLHENTI
jgi:hypothetical protein